MIYSIKSDPQLGLEDLLFKGKIEYNRLKSESFHEKYISFFGCTQVVVCGFLSNIVTAILKHKL